MIKGVITDERFGSKHGWVLLSTKLVERGKGDQNRGNNRGNKSG
jgi:hypothetical protein